MEITRFAPRAISPATHLDETKAPSAPRETPPAPQADFTLLALLERSTNALNRQFENMLQCRPGTVEARSQMWAQQLKQSGAVITLCMDSLPAQQRQQLYGEQRLIGQALQQMMVPYGKAHESGAGISSSDDFFDKLLELIDLIKNGYLAGYEHLIKAYSDFFADFNKEITAKMKEWIEGANDGKEVKLNAGQIRLALQALIQKYSHPNPASVLFPAPGMGGASREEADNWRKALGLPESCLKQNADGTFSVVMDMGPLAIMRDSLPPNVFWITWDTAKFQAWQTGFNAQEERLKNMLQSFTQKYSNANSYHDNFNKTLSSHLNQFADMLKAMLNF